MENPYEYIFQVWLFLGKCKLLDQSLARHIFKRDLYTHHNNNQSASSVSLGKNCGCHNSELLRAKTGKSFLPSQTSMFHSFNNNQISVPAKKFVNDWYIILVHPDDRNINLTGCACYYVCSKCESTVCCVKL